MAEGDVLLSSMTDRQVANALGASVRVCREVLKECRQRRPGATVVITPIGADRRAAVVKVTLDRNIYLELFNRGYCVTVSVFCCGILYGRFIARRTIRNRRQVAITRRNPRADGAPVISTRHLAAVLSEASRPVYERIARRESPSPGRSLTVCGPRRTSARPTQFQRI